MSALSPRARHYAALQRALVVLLAVNCVLYALHGMAREAADSIAWLTLLVLFYSETPASAPQRGERAIRYTRLAATAIVTTAALGYLHAAAWLDAANSALWIAVVALLEVQVRYPGFARRQHSALAAVAAVLYGGLAMLPLAWLAQREWVAAYDAMLWLAAFATLEVDLRSAATARDATLSRMLRETPR